MDDILKFSGLKEEKAPTTHCHCEECGVTSKIEDCELMSDSEGWEYPVYYYHACPVCRNRTGSDGEILDYYTRES